MRLISEYVEEVKKSKFIAYYYEIDSIDEAKEIIDKLWEDNKKARHIPYAYKVCNTAKKSDDKEPSGTAGMPIYNLLEMKQLDNCLVAVVRYFGGTKLGAGLLTRTYLNAAKGAIEKGIE